MSFQKLLVVWFNKTKDMAKLDSLKDLADLDYTQWNKNLVENTDKAFMTHTVINLM